MKRLSLYQVFDLLGRRHVTCDKSMESMPNKKIRIRTEPWHIFRQKTVTTELKSLGMMNRKELVSKTGTRLS